MCSGLVNTLEFWYNNKKYKEGRRQDKNTFCLPV